MDFKEQFAALTGHPPFPWQERLYERMICDKVKSTRIPQVCNIPTGLGKTNVIAVWLLALAKSPLKALAFMRSFCELTATGVIR